MLQNHRTIWNMSLTHKNNDSARSGKRRNLTQFKDQVRKNLKIQKMFCS